MFLKLPKPSRSRFLVTYIGHGKREEVLAKCWYLHVSIAEIISFYDNMTLYLEESIPGKHLKMNTYFSLNTKAVGIDFYTFDFGTFKIVIFR